MAENPKRLSPEETWATALAVIGGLAVLVPLIVFALGRQGTTGGSSEIPPTGVGAVEMPVKGETGDRPKLADLPIPTTSSELKKELVEARRQIDALGFELDVAKTTAEASERSSRRAWIQLREAAGEPETAPEEGGDPTETKNPS